jgi:Type IV secretion-system coupling protein DNA-binding domain
MDDGINLVAQTPGVVAAALVVWSVLACVLLARRESLARILVAPLPALLVALLVTTGCSVLAAVAGSHGPLHAIATSHLWRLVALVAGGLLLGLAPATRRVGNRYRRGARIADPVAARRGLRARRRAHGRGAVTLAGWPLSAADETKHLKLIGATGTGKSTLIGEVLEAALARGDRAIVADPDGSYLARFYRPERGDRLLTPFDARASAWMPFAEIDEPFHVDELARSLLPAADGSAREWAGYARTFVAAVLGQLRQTGEPGLGELYRVLVVADTRELALLLEGTPAQPFLEPGNERMFSSIRAVTASAVRGLDYLRDAQGPPLAVRQWVREGTGVLFLPYRADQVAALRSLVSAWLRLAIFQALSLSPTRGPAERPLWFVVDELDALGSIDGLGDALARLRKFGGRCVLGFQSIAQVSSTYGAGPAQAIVENCGNTVLLRCSAAEGGGTARFASRLIGEREVGIEQVTRSAGGSMFQRSQRSQSRTVHWRTESALLPAEIEQLPDRCGYLKLASEPAWIPVRF